LSLGLRLFSFLSFAGIVTVPLLVIVDVYISYILENVLRFVKCITSTLL
jgi:hypothetical protein